MDDREHGVGQERKKRAGKREKLRAAARAKWKSSSDVSSVEGSEASTAMSGAPGEDGVDAPDDTRGTPDVARQATSFGDGEEAARKTGFGAETGAGWGTWVRVLERAESTECVELCMVEIWPGHSSDEGAGEGYTEGGGEAAWPRAGDDVHVVHDARQMRRSMLAAGHAVVGQRAIGKCRQLDDCRGTYLCCTSLHFRHPASGELVESHS